MERPKMVAKKDVNQRKLFADLVIDDAVWEYPDETGNFQVVGKRAKRFLVVGEGK